MTGVFQVASELGEYFEVKERSREVCPITLGDSIYLWMR